MFNVATSYLDFESCLFCYQIYQLSLTDGTSRFSHHKRHGNLPCFFIRVPEVFTYIKFIIDGIMDMISKLNTYGITAASAMSGLNRSIYSNSAGGTCNYINFHITICLLNMSQDKLYVE